MSDSSTPLNRNGPATGSRLNVQTLASLLWNSAWGALWLTILVQVCGGIALGLAGGIWGEMVPALPPGWSQGPALNTGDWRWGFFEEHRFGLIYSVLFLGKLGSGLVAYSSNRQHRKTVAWLLWVSNRLTRGWFGLTVGNAFAAFLAVLFWQFAQGFSLAGFLGGLLLDLLRPLLHVISGLGTKGDASQGVADLLAWFKANQFKFMFWLFYSAAIGDDLGLPNYKALARWLWRGLRARLGLAPAAGPAAPAS